MAKQQNDRSKIIIRTSIIGIAVNVILVLFKMTVGLIANSIAVILDAVNNLSDALSSIITIVGTKLAGKRPDKKHPYGYGRIEYLTSVIISVIVLLAGITSIRESIEKIFHPEAADYSVISLIIIAAAVIAKFLVGRYVKSVGKKINSGSLIASGEDAFMDSVLSLATLLAALVSVIWHISIEGWLGAVISIFIIKAGLEMLIETLNSIIGERADSEMSVKLKETVNSFDGVKGAYDLTLHNYGVEQIIGSVHIEVDDNMTAREIHSLTRRIALEAMNEYGIILTVGIYAVNSTGEYAPIRKRAEEVAGEYEDILQLHGFYGEENHVMFDLIIDFKADASKIKHEVTARLKNEFPEYEFDIILDSDYSD